MKFLHMCSNCSDSLISISSNITTTVHRAHLPPFTNAFFHILETYANHTNRPINGDVYMLAFVLAFMFGYQPTSLEGFELLRTEGVDPDLKYTSTLQEEIAEIMPDIAILSENYLKVRSLFVFRLIYLFVCILGIILIFYVLIVFHWVKNMSTALRIRYSFAIAHVINLSSSIIENVIRYNDISASVLSISSIFVILPVSCYKVELLHLVLLGLHDLFLIKFPFKHKIIFSKGNSYPMLLLMWLIVAVELILRIYVFNFFSI